MERDLLKSVKFGIESQNNGSFSQNIEEHIQLSDEELREIIEKFLIFRINKKNRLFETLDFLKNETGVKPQEHYEDPELAKWEGVKITLLKYSKSQIYQDGNDKSGIMGLYNMKLKDYINCILDCFLMKAIFFSIRKEQKYQFPSHLIEKIGI